MLVAGICQAASDTAPAKPMVFDVWPGKVPGETGEPAEEKLTGKQGSRQLTNVSKPTLTVYRPAKDKDTRTAAIIAPGGGYNFLAWDHEGGDVARWLNSIGVTGIVLKYRVPVRKGESRDTPAFHPLQDAQRALSLVRNKAKEWGIDEHRIGMVGFSAGGHLTAMLATNFDKRGYDSMDAIDSISCRPDFAVMVYPGGVVQKSGAELVPGIRVSKETPPAFLVHAWDDRVPAENSLQLFLALKRAGVRAELHVYSTGGHGFGLRPSGNAISQWPSRCEDWLRAQRLLNVTAAQ
jgi:acetyl esterase/lipase